ALGRGRAGAELDRLLRLRVLLREVVLEVLLANPARRLAFLALPDRLPLGRPHDDVRRDADLLDRAPAGRVVERRGQAQPVAGFERVDGLHRAFAEALHADDERAVVVLERARDDLRGACGALVHEHDDRVARLGALGVGAELVALALVAAL